MHVIVAAGVLNETGVCGEIMFNVRTVTLQHKESTFANFVIYSLILPAVVLARLFHVYNVHLRQTESLIAGYLGA